MISVGLSKAFPPTLILKMESIFSCDDDLSWDISLLHLDRHRSCSLKLRTGVGGFEPELGIGSSSTSSFSRSGRVKCSYRWGSVCLDLTRE